MLMMNTLRFTSKIQFSEDCIANYHKATKIIVFQRKCKYLDDVDIKETVQSDRLFDKLGRNEVKALYPGLERIVDTRFENNGPFSYERDVDLLNQDGLVIASAGMLLKEFKVAIESVDGDSKNVFETAGYKNIKAEDFDITMLK